MDYGRDLTRFTAASKIKIYVGKVPFQTNELSFITQGFKSCEGMHLLIAQNQTPSTICGRLTFSNK